MDKQPGHEARICHYSENAKCVVEDLGVVICFNLATSLPKFLDQPLHSYIHNIITIIQHTNLMTINFSFNLQLVASERKRDD